MILYEDELGGDARWWALAELAPDGSTLKLTQSQREDRVDRLMGAYMRLTTYVGHQKDDGYIVHAMALRKAFGRPWVLDLLATPVLGKPPFLHRPGDRCGERNCIDSSPPWVPGYAYRVCAFLKRNASRAEKTRQESRKRELRDPRLRQFVYERDGGCCRYCRSGPLKRKGMGRTGDTRRIPEIEHIDPDGEAGADREGVVLACKRCNTYKGRRLPDEADMVLLEVPSAEVKAWWAERGEQQFDRPDRNEHSPADVLPLSYDDQSDNGPDNDHDNAPDNERALSPPLSAPLSPPLSDGVVARPDTGAEGQGQPSSLSPKVSGSGRVGFPADGVVDQDDQTLPPDPFGHLPDRSPDAPDIWSRRSRGDPEPTPRTRW